MKQFLTFLLCLVTSLTAGAAPTTPTFSTEDGEATWYYIRFKSNYNCYLTDCGVGNNVQVLGYDPARTADQQWKVVGESTTSITLVSRAGHKLYYNSSTLRYVTSDTEANTYKLYQFPSYWEMSRTGVSETAMRFGISGQSCFHGAVITEKNPNNDLNKFDFVPVATAQANYNTFQSKLPLLSEEEEPVWYYLSLTKDATHYLVDNGASTKVALNSTETVNDKARQWQLVPVDNEGGFALRSRLGHYITSFSNKDNIATAGDQANGRYYTGAATATINDAIVFCLGSGNTVNDFEIYRKGDSNKWGFNKRDGSEVGLWNEFDGGNKMACAEAVSFDNAFIASLPKFSDGENVYWYFLNMPNRNTYMKAADTDTKLELAASATNSDAFKWKFIGTKDNFIMVSKAGKYVYEMDAVNTENGRFQLGTESASAKAFYFDPCGDYVEIVRVGDSERRGMNDRSVNTPSGMGIWTNNAPGNGIQLIAVAEAPELVASSSELTGAIYYYMQFKTGGAVVEDKGAGTNAQTATKVNKKEQLWAFIGTNLTSLKAINKAGRYLSYNGTNYQTVAAEDNAVTFELRQSTAHPGYFELVNANATEAMNQVGGAGAGRNLGVYTIGDVNNPFKVVSTAPVEPKFYATATAAPGDEWYIMQFCNGSFNWEAPSTVGDKVTVRKSLLHKNEMMWRFVGTKDDFKLVNKNGEFAYFEGTNQNGFLKTSSSDGGTDAYKFSLVASAGDYLQAWEIKPAGVTSNDYPHLNMYQGAIDGHSISVWSAADGGNPMKFIPVSEVDFDDYTVTGSSDTPTQKFTLWYTEPATTARLYSGGQGYSNWMEWSLPIGNGQLGASLFGGVKRDEIQINEKTLWSGTASDNGINYGQYENFGSVFVENIGDDFSLVTTEGATNYYRSLDLADALGKVSFKSAKSQTVYEREYFASNPDKVIVAHYTATGSAKLNLRFTLQSGNILGRTTNYSDGSGYFSGNTFSGATQTVKYALRFKVVNTGGTLTTDENGITVTDATEVKVVISGATDFDPASRTYVSGTSKLNANLRNTVNTAAAKSYAELKSAHLDDYHEYWNRMSLELSGISNTVPTNTLIDNYNSGAGADALMLENLYFAYGRYLEIASSRGVALPSNLQGIWSNMDNPAWNADIHSNINVQMNYWPAEQTNLSEMHEPFLNYIINMANSPQWQAYATAAGQSRGWTCYTENNIFGGVGSFMHNYVIANAWYCTHLWQHYRYTLDTDYLKRAFPAMLSAAQFWMDRLVLDTDGTYVCPNEYSPEHGPASENGVAHAQQLVYDLFDNTLAAIRVLGQAEAGITDEDLANLKDRFNKLDPGLATETYDGKWTTSENEAATTRNGVAPGTTILREWKTSTYKSGQDGHRHMSHLMCLYPFSQVTPGTELYDAAVNSLRLRGDGATGWSMGWKINLWARAKDGNHSRTILNNALAHSNGGAGVFYNLFDSHAPFQIDGNFGACAGMAEMIMQSHSDTIEVLPALPSVWRDGIMRGMKAVGNFTVDITWANNKATSVKIKSHKGQPLMVKAAGIAKAVITKNGNTVPAAILAADVVRIPTAENDVIVIDFTREVAPEKGVMEILTDEGFGTFYSDRAIVMPTGVQGITVSAVTPPDNSEVGLLQMQWKYNAGDVVPARTALLIKGAKDSYPFNYSNDNPEFSGTNFLEGQMTDELISGENKKFYKLTYSKVNDVKTLGFFYGAADGAPFVSKAGKAWLAVPTTGLTSARGYRFDFGTATGIQEAQTEGSDAHAVYTLDGRRVNRSAGSLTRGIYIIGGKKIMVK